MIRFLWFFSLMTYSNPHQSLWVRTNSKSRPVHIHQASVFVFWTFGEQFLGAKSTILSVDWERVTGPLWQGQFYPFFANHTEECLEVIGSIYFSWWIHSALARENVSVVVVRNSEGEHIILKWSFRSIGPYWVDFTYKSEDKGFCLPLEYGKRVNNLLIPLKFICLSNNY